MVVEGLVGALHPIFLNYERSNLQWLIDQTTTEKPEEKYVASV